MSIKPILFNNEMVRAILDGRKTVTRRLPSKRVEEKWWEYDEWASDTCAGFARDGIPCDRTYEKEFYEQYPPYQPGDILYVRETWSEWTGGYLYKAWNSPFPQPGQSSQMKWHPSIHMPKEAARIWLKVMDVRVERLQEITDESAYKEGIRTDIELATFDDKIHEALGGAAKFSSLWNSTIKKQDLNQYGWDANPWVWVIEFERCEKPEEDI